MVNEEGNRSHKHLLRRQRLIAIGMDLFSERSYEAVAIDDIAAAANISKGLLYYYFPTKHDFYVAVVQYAAEQLLEATKTSAELEPVERLKASIHAYFSYVERYAAAYIALLRGGMGVDAQVTSILNSVRQVYVQRVLQVLPEAVASSPPHLVAINGWVAFVEAISVAWLEQHTMSREELCDLAIAAFTIILTAGREPVSTSSPFLSVRHNP